MLTYNRGVWGSLRVIVISHSWKQHIFFQQIQVFCRSVLMTCSPLVYCFLAPTGTWDLTALNCLHTLQQNRPCNQTENRSDRTGWKQHFGFTGNTLCNGDGQCLDQKQEWADRAHSSCRWELFVMPTIFSIYKQRCCFMQLWGKYSDLIRWLRHEDFPTVKMCSIRKQLTSVL